MEVRGNKSTIGIRTIIIITLAQDRNRGTSLILLQSSSPVCHIFQVFLEPIHFFSFPLLMPHSWLTTILSSVAITAIGLLPQMCPLFPFSCNHYDPCKMANPILSIHCFKPLRRFSSANRMGFKNKNGFESSLQLSSSKSMLQGCLAGLVGTACNS